MPVHPTTHESEGKKGNSPRPVLAFILTVLKVIDLSIESHVCLSRCGLGERPTCAACDRTSKEIAHEVHGECPRTKG